MPPAWLIACLGAVATWLWGEWSYRVGYRSGYYAGLTAQAKERAQKAAGAGVGLGRSTTPAELPQDSAWQPERGAEPVAVEGWGDTPPGPRPERPGEHAEAGLGLPLPTPRPSALQPSAAPPPWRVEAGGEASPVLGLRRDRRKAWPDMPLIPVPSSPPPTPTAAAASPG